MTVSLELLSNYHHLTVGTSATGVCPVCGGGNNKDVSFSVTKLHHGFVYNCFRAKCGAAGFVSFRSGEIDPSYFKRTQTKRFVPDEVNYRFQDVDSLIQKHLLKTWDISREETTRNLFKVIKEPNQPIKLWMPTFNIYGAPIGGSWKSLSKKAKIKSKAFWFKDEPKLHFPKGQPAEEPNEPIIVVEDKLSAIRVTRFRRCVALLGSSMSLQQAVFLSKMTPRLIILLDWDTWTSTRKKAKILAMRESIKLLFKDVTLLPTHTDPKDMPDADLYDLVEDGVAHIGGH